MTLKCDQNQSRIHCNSTVRSSPSEVFLGKGVLKICSKFTGEHPCRSAISIKLKRTPFPKNTSGWLLLHCKFIKTESTGAAVCRCSSKQTFRLVTLLKRDSNTSVSM